MRDCLMMIVLLLAAGCGRTVTPAARTSLPPAPPPPAPQAAAPALAPPTPDQIAAAKKMGKVRVTLATSKGDIVVELDAAAAPIAVANFLSLVSTGFYDGMPFHRVEPGFVIQAGEPALLNRPPVSYSIPDERSPIKHLRGAIAMARSYRGGQMVPNSASTQFYITLADTPHLDQIGFTAFGRVVSGLEVIDKIVVGDTIEKATVEGPGPAPPR